MNTAQYKDKLLAEKALLEQELGAIGHTNPQNPDDWHPEPERGGVVETADKNLAADRLEDFEERVAVNAALEERYREIENALLRVESNTYGTCAVCGGPIEEERLEANPAAATCKTHMGA